MPGNFTKQFVPAIPDRVLSNPEYYIMYIFSIILVISGAILLLYVAVQWLMLAGLRKRAAKADRTTHITLFGKNFRYKMIHDQLYRYKWKKGIFIVRADFDKEGKLIGTDKITFRLRKRTPDKFFE